jgi:hypothetical protein
VFWFAIELQTEHSGITDMIGMKAISEISAEATGIKQLLPGIAPSLVLSCSAAAFPSLQERSYLPTPERSRRRHSCGSLD